MTPLALARYQAADYLRQAGGAGAREAGDAIQRGDLALAYAMVRELQTDPAYQGNAEAEGGRCAYATGELAEIVRERQGGLWVPLDPRA